MSDAAAVRRQLTLFVPTRDAELFEAVRRRLDPVQHRLIAAHVTLCREDELAMCSDVDWRRLAHEAPAPVTLSFGPAQSFSGHGVWLPCVLGAADYHALRVRLLGTTDIRRHEPHLTLAHPRNSRAAENVPSVVASVPTPLRVTFPDISLVEQRGQEPWRLVDRWMLAGGQDTSG